MYNYNITSYIYVHTINCLEAETLTLVDSFCNTARKTKINITSISYYNTL